MTGDVQRPKEKREPCRKRTAIDLELKLQIITKYEGGQSLSAIAREHSLAVSTVCTIVKDAARIKDHAKDVSSMKATVITKKREGAIIEMEKQLKIWMENQINDGISLSLATIQTKARSLFEVLKEKYPEGTQSFAASNGWFARFKNRVGFTNVPLSGDSTSVHAEVDNKSASTRMLINVVPQSGSSGNPAPGAGSNSPGPSPIAPKKHPSLIPSTTAPPEVCLRWNSYHSNMQATFPSLLNNEQFVDVTLACEGRSIKCHKVMLSACSTYFEELLSQNPCQHPIVFMRDLRFWEVQALVEFMYTGEVNVAQDKLPSLLAAAEALQIKGLTNPGSSSGSNASSHEDDSNIATADNEDSASYNQPNRRVRKRKATNPTAYPQKAQALGGGSSPSTVCATTLPPPPLTPMRAHYQPTRTSLLSRVKKEPPDISPTSHLPPQHVSYQSDPVKIEPDDSCDALLDLSESDSSRKETQSGANYEMTQADQGGGPNGCDRKREDNGGLSEEEGDGSGSESSEAQPMIVEPPSAET